MTTISEKFVQTTKTDKNDPAIYIAIMMTPVALKDEKPYMAFLFDRDYVCQNGNYNQLSGFGQLGAHVVQAYYDHPNTPIAMGYTPFSALEALDMKMSKVPFTGKWMTAFSKACMDISDFDYTVDQVKDFDTEES